MSKRLDQHLADQGFFESRARARAAVMEGLVSVDGSRDVKPGTQIKGGEAIAVEDAGPRFVSRGGLKLLGALEEFGVDVRGLEALDVGASTGGFTDCLLQRGAAAVIALDVGRGQLHWKLRQDGRVTVMEGFNARELTPDLLVSEPDLAVIDVSFISLRKVLAPVMAALRPGAIVIALVKPQFEAGRGKAPKGVVRDPFTLGEVLRSMRDWIDGQGMSVKSVAPSRIRGPKGNTEFFFLVADSPGRSVTDAQIEAALRRAAEK